MRYTFIIPVYNLANCIEKTLNMLEKAVGRKQEIVVVDDGSTDGTSEILDDYAKKSSAYKIIHQSNKGVSAARNAGIEAATGDYVVFVDGDDECSEQLLQKLDSCVCNQASKPDMVVWRYDIMSFDSANEDRKVSQCEFAKTDYSGEDFIESLLNNENRIRIGSFAVKRELINFNSIRFTEGCAIGEDVEFMYKCALCSNSVVTSNDVLYTYVRRLGSAMNGNLDMRRFEAPQAMNRVYEWAAASCMDKIINNAFIMDNLKYGLYITHCMYAFEGCGKYLISRDIRNKFLEEYYRDYSHVEKRIVEARKNMHYAPKVFSEKRLRLFLFSRKVYTRYITKRR